MSQPDGVSGRLKVPEVTGDTNADQAAKDVHMNGCPTVLAFDGADATEDISYAPSLRDVPMQ
jgi:hypothetical protein